MKALIKNQLHWFSIKLKKDKIDAFSAQVSFFFVISFIPFTLFLLTLLQLININGESILNVGMKLLPKTASDFFSAILSEQRQPFTLMSVTAITCIWSASMAMLSLIKGLGSVFRSRTRNYLWLRFLAVVYTLVFAVIVAFTCVLLIFGSFIYNTILAASDAWLVKILVQFKSAIGFAILLIFFTFTYKLVPLSNKTKIRYCFVGAALSSGGWVLYSFIFSIFVENFANYSNIYGSLAAVVVVMLWMYFCMYIFFMGAEIAHWLDKSEFRSEISELRKKRKERKMKQNDASNRTNK